MGTGAGGIHGLRLVTGIGGAEPAAPASPAAGARVGRVGDTQVAAGPDDEFEAFLRAHQAELLRFLRYLRANEQDAQDAAQESFARLLRYRHSRPPDAWKPLLFRIAANVLHDQARQAMARHSKAHAPLDDHLDLTDDTPLPEDMAQRAQRAARLNQAVLRLPPKCRQVYLLRVVHGLDRDQIARRCGISIKGVEKHLAKALSLLRQWVGEAPAGTWD